MPVITILKKVLTLVVALGICLLAAYAGSQYTTPAIPTWYASLHKPDFTPPSWVFGPVWTALYILMGFSLYIILQAGMKNHEAQFALVLFALQLGFNVGWSYLFFVSHSTFFALMCIIALWTTLLCTTIQAFRVSAIAGALLIPYLIWISFAAYLNYAIMLINPITYNFLP